MERGFRRQWLELWAGTGTTKDPGHLGMASHPTGRQLFTISAIFPNDLPLKSGIPLAKLLGCHRVSSSPAAPPLPPPVHPPPETPVAARGIWHGRLRSSSNLALPSPAAVLAPTFSGAASSSSSVAPGPWPPSAPVPKVAPRLPGLVPRGRPLLRSRKRLRLAADEA